MRGGAGNGAWKVLAAQRLRAAYRKILEESDFIAQQHELKKNGVAFYNFWKASDSGNRWFARFLQRPALFRLSKSRRVAFISVFGDRDIVQRIKADVVIFYTGENLTNHPTYGDHLFGEVDLSLGFDFLERPDYLRFPCWLLMCFEPHFTLSDIEYQLRIGTGLRHSILNRPPMEASMLARYDPDGSRARVADLFSQFGQVHYGGLFRNGGITVPPGPDNKIAFLRRYPFTLCPENSSRVGYVTEKLFHAFSAGCIPVYAGSPQANIEPGIINDTAILRFHLEQPNSLASNLAALRDHRTVLQDWSERDPFLTGAAERIYSYYLQLERQLADLLA